MPILNLLPSAFSINDAFLLLSAFDRANITASSPTGVVYASNQFFGGTFTVTGTGLTTAFFGGVEYITGGTIDLA